MIILTPEQIAEAKIEIKEKTKLILQEINSKLLTEKAQFFHDTDNKNHFCEINYICNNGNIRSLNLFITLKSIKKRIHFYMEDYTICGGKYVCDIKTEKNKDRFYERNYPLAWQNYRFEHLHYFGINLINLNSSLGECVLNTGDFYEDLTDLFELVYMTSDNRRESFDLENIRYRIDSFHESLKETNLHKDLINLNIEDINYVKCEKDNSSCRYKMNSWNNSYIYFYNGKTLENFNEIN